MKPVWNVLESQILHMGLFEIEYAPNPAGLLLLTQLELQFGSIPYFQQTHIIMLSVTMFHGIM